MPERRRRDHRTRKPGFALIPQDILLGATCDRCVRLYGYLSLKLGGDEAMAPFSYRFLGSLLHWDRRTVGEHVGHLEALGVIAVEVRERSRAVITDLYDLPSGTSNVPDDDLTGTTVVPASGTSRVPESPETGTADAPVLRSGEVGVEPGLALGSPFAVGNGSSRDAVGENGHLPEEHQNSGARRYCAECGKRYALPGRLQCAECYEAWARS